MGHEKKVKPSVFTFPSGMYASNFWRLTFPTYQLNILDEISFSTSMNYLKDASIFRGVDVVWLQRATGFEHVKYIQSLAQLREKFGFRIIHDVDDVLIREDMPDFFSIKRNENFFNGEAMKVIFSLCDEITVTTPFLKEYYLSKFGHNNITVIPNRIPYFWAGGYYNEEIRLNNYRKHKMRPRILFAGSPIHINGFKIPGNDDFTHIIEAIKSSIHEFRWIFLGGIPHELKDQCLKGEVEYHQMESIATYHPKLLTLEGCIMVAPLSEHIHNHGRSNCKFQEASAQGLPIVCQDITPYKMCPIRFTTGDQMLHQIRETLETEESYINAIRLGKKLLDEMWLELDENIGMYKELFSSSYQDKDRKYLCTI